MMKTTSRITLSFIEFAMYVIYLIADLMLRIFMIFSKILTWICLKAKLTADLCMKKKFEILDTVVIIEQE